MSDKYYSLDVEKIPINNDGKALVDVFVFLPVNQKYVCVVKAGQDFSGSKKTQLHEKGIKEVFTKTQIVGDMGGPSSPSHDFDIRSESAEEAKAVKLVSSSELGKNIVQVFKGLSDGTDAEGITKILESLTDQVLDSVAPDLKTVRKRLLETIDNIAVLHDSAAINSLAILFSIANGFDSKKSFREITYATLVMDTPLEELNPEQMKLYYTNPDALDPEVLKVIKHHPAKAHLLASQKLISASETSMQLILCHHELFSGAGYPRGIRTESIFPLVRILSLAVDTFEKWKGSHLKGEDKAIIEILDELKEPNVEPHKRRHNRKIVDNVYNVFLKV